ncbi:class I SAM-dependent methyltransferase [Methylocystis sp. ATCC 49242]|uniref:class I SAM-dependent methyltransferase n=1 Tax=Methylocystis sp. ATCC 49242 TaxID=622637 RepID=UPI0001F8847B|nr:class I SAM-dependent methyltransferase [Methylocystis sp. ATCC 49242]
MSNDVKSLMRADAKKLQPGDAHYSAYVGPPQHYDFMGASQFRLLTTLGLRDHHRLLDFGCGSLRAGRLFIPYLLPGNYYGIEPNKWLIEEAIEKEVGRDQIRIKQPHFSHNSDFDSRVFGVKFNFIVAQSIFSHCGADLIEAALAGFRDVLEDDGLVLATFVHLGAAGLNEEFTDKGWAYPRCVAYRPETILGFIRSAGLVGDWIPWRHWQDWYMIGRTRAALPHKSSFGHLTGVVLRDRELSAGL